MPLLPVEQIEELSPLFKGRFGNALARALRKALDIEKLSDIYDRIESFKGAGFARAILDEFELDYRIGGASNLQDLPEGSFVTISNHPYGGMDGIMLIDLFGHIRDEYKVMVTEFLSLIKPMTSSMIVVNPKTDLQNEVTARNILGMKQVMQMAHDGQPVGFFPAGAVSNLIPRTGKIEDREWQTSVIRLIQKIKVPIVPVRFFGRNSMLFYLLGLIDWKIRLTRLPHELTNKKGKMMDIGIGKIIPVEEQMKHKDPDELGRFLRETLYGISFDEGDSISYRELRAKEK